MNYKEALLFIGKCLTILHEKTNKILVEEALKSSAVDWDEVVKTSTSHFVFPALYCNLKRANFLKYLPEELVNYMVYITDLNRERNQQIIEQATELNQLLKQHNIQPIFLKGTGNLLSNLYEDIAERMVGDIDFIFSKPEYKKTIKILIENGYSMVDKSGYHFPGFKHYPRLHKEGRIAAVEIHKELLTEKFAPEFNYLDIKDDILSIDNFSFLSYKNQVVLTICASQINDNGMLFKSISLRNAYDVFLLSKKENTKESIKNQNRLFTPLNSFIAFCFEVFGEIDSLKFTETEETLGDLEDFRKLLTNDNFRVEKRKKTSKKIFVKEKLKIILKAIFDKDFRKWIYKRVTDKEWQKEKKKQLKG